jgi:type II secretion system protein G
MLRSFNKARRGRRAGFTLIELLVVVLILGILMAVAIPLYLSSVRNARIKTTKANMKTIATAVQAYRVRFGAYPTSMTPLIGTDQDLAKDPTGTPEPDITYTSSASTVTAVDGDSSVITGGTANFDVATGTWTPAEFAE